MITLYGSTTSPFVRRLRILLANIDYNFQIVSIYDEETKRKLRKISPIAKIPIMTDGEQAIFDSRFMGRYICEKYMTDQLLTWSEENWLTLINEVNDSLVLIFLLKKNEIYPEKENDYINNHLVRIKEIMTLLNSNLHEFDNWKFHSISLLCLFEWATYRNLIDAKHYEKLDKWCYSQQQRPFVKETHPSI